MESVSASAGNPKERWTMKQETGRQQPGIPSLKEGDDVKWWEKYIGQPYVPVDGDCMSLAEQVATTELGIALQMPEHTTGLRAQARQIQRYRDEYAKKVDAPEDCQPVLFLCRKRFFHIGVSARINNEDYALHNDERHGSVILTRLRDMARIGYEFEGFYRWI